MVIFQNFRKKINNFIIKLQSNIIIILLNNAACDLRYGGLKIFD